MTPSQLRTFVAVADTASVREAAAALVVSQPAVSAALASLQRELEVKLVAREGRGLRLTPAGEVLASYARRILGLWNEAQVATVASADPERGRLRLATVTTAGEHVVPALLASFRAAHPHVEIVLEVGNRRRVWDLLLGGGADLAVGGRPPAGDELVSRALAANELVLVAAPDGRGAEHGAPENPPPGVVAAPDGRGAEHGPGSLVAAPDGRGSEHTAPEEARSVLRSVTLAALAEATWLVREPGSGTRDTTEELLSSLGLDPPRLTLGSNGAICESAAVGLGVALVSRAAAERQLHSGMLHEWRTGPLPLHREWHLVSRAGPMPASAALFVDHVLEADGGWDRPGSS